MTRKRLLPALGLLTAAGLAAAGCGTNSSNPTGNGSAPAQQGGQSPREVPTPQAATVEQDSRGAEEAPGGTLTQKELERRKIYLLGQRIGECLFRGCLVFTGVVRSAGELEAERGVPEEIASKRQRLQIAPEQLLWGDEGRWGDELTLTHYFEPSISKINPGPWTPWEGVQAVVGTRLLLALEVSETRKSRETGEPQIAAVVSDEQLSAEVRNLVARHAEFKQEPDKYRDAIEPLSQKPDDLFVGYLAGYLKWTSAGGDQTAADRAALVRASLLNAKDLPRPARGQIALQLSRDFNHMSPPAKREAANLLLSAATSEEERIAAPAINALAWAAGDKLLDLGALLDAKRRRALAANYRAARASGAVGEAHPAFEAQLGIANAPPR